MHDTARDRHRVTGLDQQGLLRFSTGVSCRLEVVVRIGLCGAAAVEIECLGSGYLKNEDIVRVIVRIEPVSSSAG